MKPFKGSDPRPVLRVWGRDIYYDPNTGVYSEPIGGHIIPFGARCDIITEFRRLIQIEEALTHGTARQTPATIYSNTTRASGGGGGAGGSGALAGATGSGGSGGTCTSLMRTIRAGEIIAWRAWFVKRNHLYSLVMQCYLWPTDRPMRSDVVLCDLDDSIGGGTGIHAFKQKESCLKYIHPMTTLSPRWQIAVGRVAMWGDVIEHEFGWRSSHAAVYSIDHLLRPRRPTLLHELRATYHVEDRQDDPGH